MNVNVISYSNPADLTPADVATINTALKTIDFAAYSLTEPRICAALLAAANRGIVVSIYLDHSEVEAEAKGNPAMPTSALSTLFNHPGIAIKVKHSMILMHLKSYCIDKAVVRDGSANFSPQGEEQQDNSMLLTDDPDHVQKFIDKFNAMWLRQDNLTILEAVEKPNMGNISHHTR